LLIETVVTCTCK